MFLPDSFAMVSIMRHVDAVPGVYHHLLFEVCNHLLTLRGLIYNYLYNLVN
jgi:hypothetical protein